MKVIIFSYDRPAMLLDTLLEWEDYDITVLDDGSDYKHSLHDQYCDYRRTSYNRGKEEFWKQWQWAFDICRNSDHDDYLFIPDDWHSYEIERIEQMKDLFYNIPYGYNIVNRGRDQCWTGKKAKQVTVGGIEHYEVGFVDCAFLTNRKALEALGFHMKPISMHRFNTKNISSGVGQQLSKRLWWEHIPMYKPIRSMAWTDQSHESKMNPGERERNPNIPI